MWKNLFLVERVLIIVLRHFSVFFFGNSFRFDLHFPAAHNVVSVLVRDGLEIFKIDGLHSL